MEKIDKEEYFFDSEAGEGAWLRRVAVEHWHPPTYLNRRGATRTMLILVDKGALEVFPVGGRSWRAEPGDLVYIANGTAQDLGVDQEEGCGLRLLVFDEIEGGAICQKTLGPDSKTLSLAGLKEINRIMENILDTLRAPWPGHEQVIYHLSLAFVLTLAGRRGEFKEDRRPYLQARELILKHWRQLESVRDLPKEVGVSQPTLGKLFKKHEGCTPHQFLLQQKMNYARYALQVEGKTVSDLAFELGFSDPFTFSRSFKTVVGASPSKFK